MEIVHYENEKTSVILGKDYCPNSAMKNEFQSEMINVQMVKIELHGQKLLNYQVDHNAQFILFHLKIRNIYGRRLLIDSNDFYVKFDGQGPYPCEEFFNYPNQFYDRFYLEPYASKEGILIFVVSKNCKKIMLSYDEEYEDNCKMYKLKYILS